MLGQRDADLTFFLKVFARRDAILPVRFDKMSDDNPTTFENFDNRIFEKS